MKNFVTLVEKWEEDKYTPKAASTVIQNGGFLSYDGSGGVIPSAPGVAIMGLGQEDVLSSDVDFTSTRKIAYQTVYNNYFNITVGLGVATASMVGSTFNLYTPETLDVTVPVLTYGTLAGGTFAVGDTITLTSGTGAGSTATVLGDDGSGAMTIQVLTVVGDGFLGLGTIDNGAGVTAVTTANTGLIGDAVFYDTLVGGPFTVGEEVTITSGTGTGSSAIVMFDNLTDTLFVNIITNVGTGFFTVGGAMLGLVSGATANITGSLLLPVQVTITNFISATQVEVKVALIG